MPGRGRALSGARESNAGDDFHVLWAARRALRLLDRLSGLQRIAVEGVTPLEEVDSDDEGFLGVDLTEYLGGDSFPEADRVVTTQLKYSTRNPNRAWTASRITSGGSRSAKGASVVKRLADVYKTFSVKHGRTEVVRKLRVRLVSNQPLEDTLHAALTMGQSVLTEKGTVEVRSADLFKHLPAHLVDVLKRMYRGSKLRSVEFTDFLRVLDLSGCGEEGRIRQRIRLIQELAPSVINDPVGDDFLTVRSLVQGVAVLALHRALDAWRGSSAAISWTPQGVGSLLLRHLPDIVTRDYNARDNLRTILSKADLAVTPTSLLLPAAADHIETLDTRALYDIADVMVADLTPAKQGEVFDWSIRRVEEMVARDEGSLPDLPPKVSPVEAPAALAGLLWAAFGHPWKPVRWRAAHAARALLRLPTPALLRALIDLSKSKTAGAFRAEHLEFFWMGARTWLLVVLERLADERPDTVRAEIGSIIEHALTPELPHAQIRELAKRIALRLAERDPGALSKGTVEKLRLSNEPSECLYPRRSSYSLRLGNRLNDTDEERVGFDDMDTVPYWFTPLGRVFAQGPRVVADKAGRWIVDRWGRTSADWWNDPRELRRERLAGFFMNRHGSIPRAESLRLYLFYQSMQCVAGEMVDELPMLVEEYDDECPWTDWLEEHLPASQDFWLADLRSPTPFRQESWGYYPPLEEWLRREDPAEFEAALGIGEPGHEGEIVLDGYVEDWDRERRGTMKVMSALVSPGTSTALLHALQTSDPHNFRLPYEGERLDNGASEISEPGFVLEGLITEWRRERRYLDEHDPLTRGIKGYLPQLGRNFLQVLGLSASEDLLTYSRPDGETVAHLEVWSDNPEERDYITKAFSTGERLWVRTEVLLDYLRRRGMDLVIEAQIARNVEQRHGRGNQIEEREYDLGESTIYILRRDGSLETMAGRRALGTPHST